MRKHFLILMLMALLPLGAFAQGTGANITYTFTWDANDKATITGFVDGATKGNIIIPAKVQFPKAEGQAPSEFVVTPSFFYPNSIAILFPYVRSFISTLSLQANIQPIVLPTLNLKGLEETLRNNTTIE